MKMVMEIFDLHKPATTDNEGCLEGCLEGTKGRKGKKQKIMLHTILQTMLQTMFTRIHSIGFHSWVLVASLTSMCVRLFDFFKDLFDLRFALFLLCLSHDCVTIQHYLDINI
jgi:hypothetical protein